MIDPVDVGIVAVYFIGLILIGVWASRKVHSMGDYVVAGRSLGFWVFTMLMVGSVASGMSLLGVSGLGYNFGWPTIWEQIFVPLSIAFCIIFFGAKMNRIARASGYMTVQDYLSHRYESPVGLRSLSAMAGIVVSLIYLAGQYTAVSIVLMWLFGIPHIYALLIGAAIVTIYTVIGGLYAVAWTTLIQGAILVSGVVVMAPLVIAAAGGFEYVNTALATINPSLVDPWVASGVFTPTYVVSFSLLLMIGLACAPHVINNVLAVKDVNFFRWAPIIAFVAYTGVMFLLKFAGFAGKVLVAEGMIVLPAVKNASDFIFVEGVEFALPNIYLWGIFGVIVLAAVMSTTDRLMLTIGTYFSWDIYKSVVRPKASDTEVLRVSKLSVFAAAVVTLILAINPPEMLVWLIWAGIGIMFATFAVPLLGGLYWRRATREGAIASMALGLISAGLFGGISYFKIAPLPAHFSLYAVIISLTAMVLVSLLTKPTDERVLDETMTGWFIQPRSTPTMLSGEIPAVAEAARISPAEKAR
ncbi:MAG: sodium:solute symporter family protein [Methanomicrobiales archaeon]|nr:sodium:solute symporter family protein [Methanomicrobiales archaeon]MDI6876370.1 sodium:solute symporter family protein [Methanomicrobiales archaeon]